MDDETIINKGGDDRDIEEYAKQNGADLDEQDFREEGIKACMSLGLPEDEAEIMVDDFISGY